MKLNKQNKIIVGVLALILTLTVGYAMFSQSLNITGTAKAEGSLDIVFSSVGEITAVGANVPTTTIVEEGKKLEIGDITLEYPTAYVSLPVIIVNNGSIDGLLESITVENLETDDIKVSISGVLKNQIIKPYNVNDDTTKVNIVVKIEWLDKESISTLSTKNISILLNTRQVLTSDIKTTTSNESSFPIVTGQLGESVFYTYNNGDITITGSGDMSEGLAGEEGNCASAFDSSYCYLGAEISEKVVNELNIESNNEKMVLSMLLAQFITGKTFNDIGMTKEQMKTWLSSSSGPGLSESEAEDTVRIFDSVPKLNSISLSDEITSLRNDFFKETKINSITLPKGIKTLNSVFNNCTIENIYLNEGLEVINTSAINNVSGLSSIEIPSSVTSIGRNDFSDSLTTIVNKTKREFDWNYILTGDESAPFETGTVTNTSGNTITITK